MNAVTAKLLEKSARAIAAAESAIHDGHGEAAVGCSEQQS